MKERIVALDALRGFALVGIIIGNVTWFCGHAVAGGAERSAMGTAGIDSIVAFMVHVLVDGKFYGLFSLIFGAGFELMAAKAEARGLSVGGVVRRRLAALFTIGALHATLVWFGDIISLYAVAAVPLLWMRSWSVRRLATAAIACLLVPVVLSTVVLTVHVVAGGPAEGEGGHGPAALIPAFEHGGIADLLAANWVFLRERWELAVLSSRPIRLLGFFALGVCAVRLNGRWRGRRTHLLLPVALVGNVGLALLADVPVRPPSLLGLARDLIYAVAVPTGSLAYVAVLWPRLSSRGATTRMLAAAGRLSLSHYLTQSLLLGTIFYGAGFGLWGRVGLMGGVSIALAIAWLQVSCSGAWLRWRGVGPAEQVLRWLIRSDRGRRS